MRAQQPQLWHPETLEPTCWHIRQVSGGSTQQQPRTDTTCAWAGSMLSSCSPLPSQSCNDTAATIRVNQCSLRRGRLAAHLLSVVPLVHRSDSPAHKRPEMTYSASKHPLDHLSGQLPPQASATLRVRAAACMHAQQPRCWQIRQVSGGSKQQQPRTDTTCAWAGSMLSSCSPLPSQSCNDTAATIRVNQCSLRRGRLAAHLLSVVPLVHRSDSPAHKRPEMTYSASKHPLDHLSGQLPPQASATLRVRAAACMHAQQPRCWHIRQVSGGSKQQQPRTDTTCAWAGSMLPAVPPCHHRAATTSLPPAK